MSTYIPKWITFQFFFPNAEIAILGTFNDHHQVCLSLPFTDYPDQLTFSLVILHDVEQLRQHPTCIPHSPGDIPNIPNLFPNLQSVCLGYYPNFSLCLLH